MGRVLLLTGAALSLGMSFAHLLQMPPRLLWPPELWMATTNFGGQFILFGTVGAAIDLATLGGLAAFAIASRRNPRVRPATVAALAFGLALALWLAVVAPANAVMAGWQPGLVPDAFAAVRLRWEAGHAAIAIVKLAGFVALAIAVAIRQRERAAPP
jgi:hypothetical protein